MFKLLYKAGWMQKYEVFGVYKTREEAQAACRQIPRKPKIWGIKIEREIDLVTPEDCRRFLMA